MEHISEPGRVRCWIERLDGSRLRVPARGLQLGRGADCAFQVLDSRVSYHHAVVDVRDEIVFLSPRGGSTVRLNGVSTAAPKALRDGDWLSLAPGHLLRVRIDTNPPDPWILRRADQDAPIVLQAEEPAVMLDTGIAAQVDASGALFIQAQQPATLNGVSLPVDRRRWSLRVGDVLSTGSGVRFAVTDSPVVPPPAPFWTLRPMLRYVPPRLAMRVDEGLRLDYADETFIVSLSADEIALAGRLLVARDAGVILDEGDAQTLQQLRESFIAAGLDGFSLIQGMSDVDRVQMPIADDLTPAADVPIRPESSDPQPEWWLILDNGGQLRIDAGGVLMGRQADCELRFLPKYIHRHHALLWLVDGKHVELISLGRHPTYHNLVPIERPMRLREGDEISVIPEARMWVERRMGPSGGRHRYRLKTPDQVIHDKHQTALTIGGGDRDDFHIAAWPEAAAQLFRNRSGLFVIAMADGMSCRGGLLAPGTPAQLFDEDTIGFGDARLTIVAIGAANPKDIIQIIAQPFSSQNGRLLFRLEDGSQHRVMLSHASFLLMTNLLEAQIGDRLREVIRTREPDATEEITPAEPISGAITRQDLRNELVAQQRMSTQDLAALITTCRAALVRAGLNGVALIDERIDQIGLNLPPSCSIDLYR